MFKITNTNKVNITVYDEKGNPTTVMPRGSITVEKQPPSNPNYSVEKVEEKKEKRTIEEMPKVVPAEVPPSRRFRR